MAAERGGFTVAAGSWLLGAALTGLAAGSIDPSPAGAAYAGEPDATFAGDVIVTTPISDAD